MSSLPEPRLLWLLAGLGGLVVACGGMGAWVLADQAASQDRHVRAEPARAEQRPLSPPAEPRSRAGVLPPVEAPASPPPLPESAAEQLPWKQSLLGTLTPLGEVRAPILVVAFTDLQCRFCATGMDALVAVAQRHDDVSIVLRDAPLPNHENAVVAHHAARCADEQGRLWPMTLQLGRNHADLGADRLPEHAREAGLELSTWSSCMESLRHVGAIEADRQQATALGVSGVPAYLINGRWTRGAQSEAAFESLFQAERARGTGWAL